MPKLALSFNINPSCNSGKILHCTQFIYRYENAHACGLGNKMHPAIKQQK